MQTNPDYRNAPAASAQLARWRGRPGWPLVVVAAVGLLFLLLPQIDLATSALFAQGAAGFPLQHERWLGLFNDSVLTSTRIASALLLGIVLVAWLAPPAWALSRQRRALTFVFLALALGPGLLVNVVLKDYSGRARPVQIVQFGGSKQFTRAFFFDRQCERNCSLASGHVAAATMPVAGYYIASTRRRRRLWLGVGLLMGAAVGLARLAVGAHFLSDVLVAMFLTWAVCALLAALLLRGSADAVSPRPEEAQA